MRKSQLCILAFFFTLVAESSFAQIKDSGIGKQKGESIAQGSGVNTPLTAAQKREKYTNSGGNFSSGVQGAVSKTKPGKVKDQDMSPIRASDKLSPTARKIIELYGNSEISLLAEGILIGEKKGQEGEDPKRKMERRRIKKNLNYLHQYITTLNPSGENFQLSEIKIMVQEIQKELSLNSGKNRVQILNPEVTDFIESLKKSKKKSNENFARFVARYLSDQKENSLSTGNKPTPVEVGVSSGQQAINTPYFPTRPSFKKLLERSDLFTILSSWNINNLEDLRTAIIEQRISPEAVETIVRQHDAVPPADRVSAILARDDILNIVASLKVSTVSDLRSLLNRKKLSVDALQDMVKDYDRPAVDKLADILARPDIDVLIDAFGYGSADFYQMLYSNQLSVEIFREQVRRYDEAQSAIQAIPAVAGANDGSNNFMSDPNLVAGGTHSIDADWDIVSFYGDGAERIIDFYTDSGMTFVVKEIFLHGRSKEKATAMIEESLRPLQAGIPGSAADDHELTGAMARIIYDDLAAYTGPYASIGLTTTFLDNSQLNRGRNFPAFYSYLRLQVRRGFNGGRLMTESELKIFARILYDYLRGYKERHADSPPAAQLVANRQPSPVEKQKPQKIKIVTTVGREVGNEKRKCSLFEYIAVAVETNGQDMKHCK